jgi:hypothetical protein
MARWWLAAATSGNRTNQSTTQLGADVQSKKGFAISESSYPDTRFDHGREPLVKQLVEAHDRSARDTPVFALLQLEI